MKVFVTGGTGFIGTCVVEQLAQAGHTIRCLVRPTSDIGKISKFGVQLIHGDVTDRVSLLAGMNGCDWLFNLANVYSFWEPDKRIYRKVNVEGTRVVLETALDAGVSKVVHVSSAVTYGNPADCPFTEESAVGAVHFSEYARTKYEGELIAWDLHARRGLPLVVIYPGAVIGPGDPKTTGRYIRDLMRRRVPAAVFPDSVLTLVHVRDVATAICSAATKEGNIGERYLVGAQRLAFRELNEMVGRIAKVRLPRMTLPGPLAELSAALLTAFASVVKRPPIWGMSMDQIRTMKNGFQFDGSKVERELGIVYTPISVAIEETVASFASDSSR